MLNAAGVPDGTALEQCIDEIDEFIGTLERYQGPYWLLP
jgi:hypothetical protein